MAAKSSGLVDETSAVNLQTEGHADVPPQSAKDLWELEALDSSPYHSPSWSLPQSLPYGCANMKHCLEIHVTLTEELGAVPHPLILGQPPLWKICCVMLGLDLLKQVG